ncbi:nucleoside-diphosphate-sugar epimerase [Micromonospora sp. M71_S20]|uniref:NAD-dependent epimerase/dehydratase family protein n=1 Tax=Micromonospora sp. M71_S20 TaxID=592872 RepID=UPI000EB51868|nr:NAD-dependent epimerase/dehydratase family protein [Micromonospora sp. M71_S20]RLK09998.1 nucleoside-diphosphate-sugar epimerase [Micromonospora sp. M71_S20]
MLVLVTGGTGFIGSHSTAAILGGGHRVRMLVRDPSRARRMLTALGAHAERVELVTGDVTDPAAVGRAADGCAAALHAAGVYSFDARDRARMAAVNLRGTEVVLGAARAAGLDPIVHVSTFGALLPAARSPLTVDSPVGAPGEAYLRSKAAAERVARRHQDDGAPVVITYPLASLGPDDPHLGDQTTRVRNVLRGLMPLWPTGGFPVGDVRDVARLHAAVLEPGRGPRRYPAPGRYVTTREFVDALRRVTGRTLPTLRLPARALLPMGHLVSAAQRLSPVHLPAEHGAIYLCATARPMDATPTQELLGPASRSLDETMTDTVRWLHRTGRLSRRQAGLAALPATAAPRRAANPL